MERQHAWTDSRVRFVRETNFLGNRTLTNLDTNAPHDAFPPFVENRGEKT